MPEPGHPHNSSSRLRYAFAASRRNVKTVPPEFLRLRSLTTIDELLVLEPNHFARIANSHRAADLPWSPGSRGVKGGKARMAVNDKFWSHLLAHLRQQVLVPVIGPDVTLVKDGDSERTLASLIAERLADQYGLTAPSGITTVGDAVVAFLREHDRDEVEWLYPGINDIIDDLNPVPGQPLRDLAAIDDLHTFVVTTPDRMLATALNEVRFQGRPRTREVQFSLNQSTRQQSSYEDPAAPTDTVVLSLFGQAASMPTYAIHEEDKLEWLHALLSDSASLPSWLDNPLKSQPMLFIGCEIPEWIGRFLLRKSSSLRLSMERIPFFFVGCPESGGASLSDFFNTYCSKTLVQQLEMEPAAFVSELRSRWEERHNSAARGLKSIPRRRSSRHPKSRRFSSAICARTRPRRIGSTTRSPAWVGTCGWTSSN